jgi:SOS-response transcriptional repressor LexA
MKPQRKLEPDEKTPAERLRDCRIKAGYRSARSAAIDMGWHPTTYGSHENGNRTLTRDAAERYADGYGVTAGFLLYGKEGKIVDLGQSANVRSVPIFAEEDGPALLSYITAAALPHDTRRYPMPNDGDEGLPSRAFAFLVSSPDMICRPPILGERSFNPGDVVVAAPDSEVRAGDFVICRIDKGLVALRKLRGAHTLAPLNHDYETVNVETHHARILGRVVRHIQKI